MKAIWIVLLSVMVSGVALANECPDFKQNGTERSLSSDELFSKRSFNVEAGGPNRLSQCHSVPGIGYLTTAPDLTLTYNASNRDRMLSFKLVGGSSCDTALLVNDAGGQWHYNDDSSNLDPVIKLSQAPSGIYDIWFVNIASGLCNAVLEIETF
jgi:hypothetical protein